MTARERILAIRLVEKVKRNADYAKSIGISARLKANNTSHKISA